MNLACAVKSPNRNRVPSNPEKPRREEWDFRLGLLPGPEVVWCREYESGRIQQSQAWRDGIAEFRQESGGSTSEIFMEHAKRCERERGALHWAKLFYTVWPEWPTRPFLSVSAAERKKRIRSWVACFESEPRTLEVFDVGGLVRRAEYKHFCEKAEMEPPFETPFDREAIVGKTITFRGSKSEEIVAFHLRYKWETTRELVDRFAAWTTKRKKELGIRDGETRGAASFIKQMRADLCALGAWRLIHGGMSRVQAANYTQAVSGRPLLSHHSSDWTRALARARRAFRLDEGG